jgi:hypothetical protein
MDMQMADPNAGSAPAFKIARFVRRIACTLEIELDCDGCAQLAPLYVDALLAGQDEAAYPGNADPWALLHAHIEQCAVCAEEFASLREVARMELEETWPAVKTLLDWAARGGPVA